MAKKTIKAQMKQRRDTKANWEATNPVLLAGELGIVSDDPNLYKVGDGATAWNSLPFRGFDGTLAQELGTSPNAVISQKVVSEKLTVLKLETGGGFFTLKAQAVISDTGKVVPSITGLDSTDYIPIAQGVRVGVFGGWRNIDSKITPIAFYDENKIFLSAYTGENKATGEFYYEPDEVPVGAKYIRCCANTLRYPNPIILGCGIKGAIDYINDILINDILKYENAMVATQVALPSSDLNTIGGHHIYLLADSYQYENAPYANAIGFLRVTTTGQYTLQEFYPFSGNKLYKRRGSILSNTWTEWGEISGTGVIQNITNEYNYPAYNATYEISVSPAITTSTNNFLAAKTDGSDRTAEIVAMLQSTGICRLGTGTFVVKDLIMPDNSMIIGSGASTKILLTEGGKFAIKMTDYCSVKDLSIAGSESNISVSENLQERHGILWQGDFAQTENYANQPYMGHIDNVWISRFAGGGITCYNTGYGTSNMLEVVNVSINNCSAGINISYWSEFHKFTNVRCSTCYYGCINNGGNNVFVNCDFSSSTGIAFLMDNSQNQSPNNSHGSAIGCVFNHTASNTGIGVKILNNDAGFVFDGCQIFYSQIYIEESNGVLFTSCNLGQSNCDITIKGGNAILFANNLFGGSPSISITQNTTTRFVNCLVRSTGAEIVS